MSRLLLLFLACLLFDLPNVKAEQPMDKEQIEKWSSYYQQLAKSYELRLLGGSEDEVLRLQSTPALRWHNPIRATTHGECFVWTKGGRPHAVASLFSYPSGDGRRVAHAFNAFGTQPLVLQKDGREFWRVAQSSLSKLTAIPNSPPVAESANLRMAQMRNIARRFTASSGGTDLENPRELRLLTSPLYRYPQDAGSNADNNSEGDIDGALFSFAMGTDPEVFLLLESSQTEAKSEWRFVVARHAHTSLYVSYQGVEVWSYQRGKSSSAFLSQHGIDFQPKLLP